MPVVSSRLWCSESFTNQCSPSVFASTRHIKWTILLLRLPDWTNAERAGEPSADVEDRHFRFTSGRDVRPPHDEHGTKAGAARPEIVSATLFGLLKQLAAPRVANEHHVFRWLECGQHILQFGCPSL